jgi:hypothetical protein
MPRSLDHITPPRLQILKVIIVPTGLAKLKGSDGTTPLFDACKACCNALVDAGVRAECDLRKEYSPPWKYNHYELKGKTEKKQTRGNNSKTRIQEKVREQERARKQLLISFPPLCCSCPSLLLMNRCASARGDWPARSGEAHRPRGATV